MTDLTAWHSRQGHSGLSEHSLHSRLLASISIMGNLIIDGNHVESFRDSGRDKTETVPGRRRCHLK